MNKRGRDFNFLIFTGGNLVKNVFVQAGTRIEVLYIYLFYSIKPFGLNLYFYSLWTDTPPLDR